MKIQNLIGGKLTGAETFLPNFEPATGQIYSEVPDSGPKEVELAVEAAERAFPEWAARSPKERGEALRKVSFLIEERLDDLAKAESQDTGKPVSLARRLDIPRSAKNFSFFADAISEFSNEEFIGEDPPARHQTLRDPLGVVACISPWNLPLYLLSWKIAPALAAGNTVVAKPSEVTPLTAYLLSEISIEAGLPPGVLNIVHGKGGSAGVSLVSHPKIKAVSFTGSTKTGGEISKVVAPHFKKISLEMGGKNPTIVFKDANFEKALDGALKGAFTNQGEICLCGSRILIERSIYSEFKEALVNRTKALKVGDPIDPETDQGALVSKEHLEKVALAVETAKKEGGKIVCGGSAPLITGRCKEGYFYLPTLIEGLPSSCATNQEEIFGPVATLIPFETEEEAIGIANDTKYGLSASVWTNDLKQAHRVSKRLESGLVWINCWMVRDLRVPFGGVKQSGVGREGGTEALRFFTEAKSVCEVF